MAVSKNLPGVTKSLRWVKLSKYLTNYYYICIINIFIIIL
jgi:hypothetical protein